MDFFIDDITWNDLNMDDIYAGMDTSASSVGSEYLKKTLRTLLFDGTALKKRNKRIVFFSENKEAASLINKYFKKLGKTKKISFLDYIFRLKEVPKKSNALHYILILLLIIAIALIFIKPAIGIVAFVVMIAVNIIIYFKARSGIEGYFLCLKYLVSMTVCAEKIERLKVLDEDIFRDELEGLNTSVKKFSSLKRGSWLITNSVSGSLVDVIMDYIRMIFHVDLIKFNSMKNIAVDNEDQIKLLYDSLGEIEMCSVISGYRERLSYYSEPVFYDPNEDMKDPSAFAASEIYHPLVKAPVSNSIKTVKPVLLTGSNASGKSTFLKAVAISQIFSQTIYTCLAERYLSTFYKVISSMALNDNILGNESYFVVEIRSLKRIFDEIKDAPVMCFIDEVLRGTNTVERIAASSRILEDLSSKGVLVFAATHDIELTSLLDTYMDNYHFSESVEGEGVSFDYKLKAGPTDTSNAIKLLKVFGFDDKIVDASDKRADEFKNTGIWK